MAVWKQEDEFSRAEKVEKTAPTRDATKSRGKNRRPGSTAIEKAQGLLSSLDYDPGPADGILGTRSRDAIKRYQVDAGLNADGEVTEALLDSLYKANSALGEKLAGSHAMPREKGAKVDGSGEGDIEEGAGDDEAGQATSDPIAVLTVARPYFDNDREPKADALNVRAQATIFAKLIAAREVALPLSIGLFGNWGSGKSYFMKLINEEIVKLEAGEDPTNEKSMYMRRVAQIEFNAWHYVDTNLWASLANHIFDGLASELRPRPSEVAADSRARLRAETESSKSAKTDAENRQREAQREREEGAVELEKITIQRRRQSKAFDIRRFRRLLRAEATRNSVAEIKGIAKQFGFSDAIETAEDAAKLAEQMRALNGRARGVMQAIAQKFADWRSASVAIAVIAAFIAVFIVVSMAFPDTSVYVGEVVAAVSGAVVWTSNRLAQIAKGVALLDGVQASLATLKPDEGETPAEQRLREKIESSDARIRTAESQIAEADRRIAEAEAELQRINAGGLVYDFLKARGADPEYKKELGIISTIQHDFKGLEKLLRDWNENYEAGSRLPPIERIVLYIDDLDRCHPDKVVEVLQAVHLLLAFDLFVVIVAVDPRWLERSLYRAYVPELAERNLNGMEAQHLREFSPQNYLEKIFQIPFSLAAMSSDGYVKLINDLIVTRSEFQAQREKAATDAPSTGMGDGGGGRTGETAEPTSPAGPEQGTEASGGADVIEQQAPEAQDAPSGPPPKPSTDEEVLFNDWEQAFLQTLHPFVPTPRLAKRLINIYRLIRVHALETASPNTFIAPNGDYRAVLVLLALNIGHSRVGGPLLRLLASERRVNSFRNLLAHADATERTAPQSIKEDVAGSIREFLKYDEATAKELVRVRDKIDRIPDGLAKRSSKLPQDVALSVPDDIETYARWAPEVGRFSFHWNLE